MAAEDFEFDGDGDCEPVDDSTRAHKVYSRRPYTNKQTAADLQEKQHRIQVYALQIAEAGGWDGPGRIQFIEGPATQIPERGLG